MRFGGQRIELLGIYPLSTWYVKVRILQNVPECHKQSSIKNSLTLSAEGGNMLLGRSVNLQ